MSRLINFCFTINNPTDQDFEALYEFAENLTNYMIVGEEVGQQGTPHLQGYAELKRKMTFNKLKSVFLPLISPHIEKRKGSQKQAIEYCKKEGTYEEYGTRKKQGERNDIKEITKMIKVDKISSLKDIIPECSNFQSLRIAEKLLPIYESKRNSKPFVYYLYGETGTGKTRLAYSILGEECYSHTDTGKFFNGYDGEENVLFDDFRKHSFQFNFLLRLLDRYPVSIEVKGGARQFKGTLIVITSDGPPEEIFCGKDLSQFLRRIDVVWNITGQRRSIVLPPTFGHHTLGH